MRFLPVYALIAWAVLIFIGSSIPNPPDAGGEDWKYELAHIFEYTVFSALAFWMLRDLWKAPLAAVVLAAWAISVLYGISDEFHQSFVANRDASWFDVGMDAIGAALGVGVALLVLKLRAPASRLSPVD